MWDAQTTLVPVSLRFLFLSFTAVTFAERVEVLAKMRKKAIFFVLLVSLFEYSGLQICFRSMAFLSQTASHYTNAAP